MSNCFGDFNMMYDIAGVKTLFHYDFVTGIEWLDGYRNYFCGRPDIEVYFKGVDSIGFPDGKVTQDQGLCWCVAPDRKVSIIVYSPMPSRHEEIVCRFNIEQNWDVVNALYLKNAPGIEEAIIKFLGNIILRYVILKHKGILLHASSVKWNNHGIAFAAPSGTGKSTHADLWKRYYGAAVLNDDSPAIKIKDNDIFVFGTPWSGSQGINTNDNAHLDMIVILEQATENHISKLETRQILSRLMPRFLVPFHDEDLMKTAIDNISQIIESTPVYLLCCKPEKEAVDLVIGCLK